MDVTSPNIAGSPVGVAGYGPGEVPEEVSDAILRRHPDEAILWRGKPDFLRLAATAFHTNTIAVYFVLLVVIAVVAGSSGNAMMIAGLGVAGVMILYGLAYLAAKKSTYILTSHRFVLLTGVALEKRISIPLKHIGAAHLKQRSGGYGDIALEISGDQRLGYFILWPHARPLRMLTPQPLLRVIPNAEQVAMKIAEACAAHTDIERNLIEVNQDQPKTGKIEQSDIATDVKGLKGAPA